MRLPTNVLRLVVCVQREGKIREEKRGRVPKIPEPAGVNSSARVMENEINPQQGGAGGEKKSHAKPYRNRLRHHDGELPFIGNYTTEKPLLLNGAGINTRLAGTAILIGKNDIDPFAGEQFSSTYF